MSSQEKLPKYVMDNMFPHGHNKNDNYMKLCDKQHKFEQKFTEVVGLVILNEDNQILTAYNSKRQVWDIPQGVVEEGEEPFFALTREVKEEIDLDITNEVVTKFTQFVNISQGIPQPFTTRLYYLQMKYLPKDSIKNNEPNKNLGLSFRALSQLPQPQGLSLRIVAEMLK